MTASKSNVVKLTAVKETKYDSLVKEGLALDKESDGLNWKFGELAGQVTKGYGEDRLGQFAKDIGVGGRYLMDCRTTCRKWPQKNVRPLFSIAYALNPHPQRAQIVAKNPGITHREAVGWMKAYNAKQLDKQAKQLDEEDKKAIESGEAVVEIESEEGAYTRSLFECACEGYAMAKRAKRYLGKATLDKKVMDAISDAAKAWAEMLNEAVTDMEEAS